MGTRPHEVPRAGELGELAFLGRDAVPSLSNAYTKAEAESRFLDRAEADDLYLTDSIIGTKPDQVPLVGMLARRAFSDGPMGTADIADSAITTEKIAAGAVATVDLADAAVTTAKIADTAITTAKLGDSQVTRAKLSGSTIVPGTSQNSTSGTSIDFTGIPSWARRVTVLFNGVSTTGAVDILVQLGVGSTPTTSGYAGGQTILSWSAGVVSSTSSAGIPVYNNAATYAFYGRMVLENITGNTWVASGLFVSTTGAASTVSSGGSIALADVLGMVRITTALGTPTFDAGSINVLYE